MKNLSCLAVFLAMFAGCEKKPDTVYHGYGKLQIAFHHAAEGNPLQFDTMIYHSAAMYNYKVADLQYIISGVTLYRNGGEFVLPGTGGGIHYVDARIPSTRLWVTDQSIAPGTFDSLSFTFGLNAAENLSNRFPDPPLRDMAWPDILGGGYHYMKMNLVYGNSSGTVIEPFMFHLGIGQLYSSSLPNPDSITGYVQNFFRVTLLKRFIIAGSRINTINCTMQVDHWFDGPESFNFDDYPGGIMQSQPGMQKACANGRKAFSGTISN